MLGGSTAPTAPCWAFRGSRTDARDEGDDGSRSVSMARRRSPRNPSTVVLRFVHKRQVLGRGAWHRRQTGPAPQEAAAASPAQPANGGGGTPPVLTKLILDVDTGTDD